MSSFVPKKEFLQRILLHYFIQTKSIAETHILIETYGDHALSETTCRDWFKRSRNNFNVEDKECSGVPKSMKIKNWRHYFMLNAN